MTQPGDQPNPWSREGQWPGQNQPAEPVTPAPVAPPTPTPPSTPMFYPTPPTPPAYPAPQPYPTPPAYPAPEPYPAPPPPQRPRRVGMWVTIGVAAALVTGLAMWGVIADDRAHPAGSGPAPAPTSGSSAPASGDTRVVTATDKKCQLTVPASWQGTSGSFKNEFASIQLGDPGKDQFALVVSADNANFDDLPGFSEAVIEEARTLITEAQVSDARQLTLGGLNATQYLITGKARGFKVVMWFTMVQGKNGFYEVVGWTSPAKRTEAEPVVLKVIESFRELGAG